LEGLYSFTYRGYIARTGYVHNLVILGF